jgi:hypothetical protein
LVRAHVVSRAGDEAEDKGLRLGIAGRVGCASWACGVSVLEGGARGGGDSSDTVIPPPGVGASCRVMGDATDED